MATLQLQHYSGEVETRELDKRQPLSIGRHERNDIVIDDDDVAIMHCRIAGTKTGFEVVAANLDGVDLNGTLVRKAEFKPGDVLRVGTVDITLNDDGSEARGGKAPESSAIELKPISSESIPLANWSGRSMARTLAAEEESSRRHRTLEEDESASRRPAGEKPPRKRRRESPPPPRKTEPAAPLATLFEDEDDGEIVTLPAAEADDDEDGHEIPLSTAAEDEPAAEGKVLARQHSEEEAQAAVAPPVEKPPLAVRLKELKTRLSGQNVRPGEQDLIRHPLVLTLGGGAAILGLVAATLWFIIGRQSAERDYLAAAALMDSREYAAAIRQFTEFIQDHPASQYTEQAIYNRGKARVLQHIYGTAGKWKEGLEALNEFIRENSDRPSFPEHLPDVVEYAQQIALGAARTSQRTKDGSLLEVIDEARTIVQRRSPVDDQPRELLARIDSQRRVADFAVNKQQFFDARVAEIETALRADQPIRALEIRAKLLERFPDLVSDARVVALLNRSLETERSIVEKLSEADAAPEPALHREERPIAAAPPVSFTRHSRARRSEVSDERTPVVYAVAGGCAYGLDSLTGRPLWRRTIGLDNPVFPIPVETSTPGLLLFDRTWRDLVLVNRRTGELLWRLELGDEVGGQPLVIRTQCIVPTLGNRLYKIDLESGRVLQRWTFSQSLLAPPALVNNGEHVVIAGDEALLYVLSVRPLECKAVVYLGHRAGSIDVAPVAMGKLLLVAENDRSNQCRLHVLSVRQPEQGLPRVAEARVDGLVRDPPVLRRNQLFVPSSGERIAAFTVSDEEGKPPLVRIAEHQLQTPHSGPMHLYGGADGQLWLGTSAVRRFQLQADTIKLDQNAMPAGVSTQPLLAIGSHLYSGRRLPYAQAVLFTRAEQEQMVGEWLAVLGERVLALTAGGGGSLVCVTETGSVFRVTAADLEAGGFQVSDATQLRPSERTIEPLRAGVLPDGKVAVACGLPEPQLWIVNTLGQMERRWPLDEPLEAAPVALADGFVLPLPGRLQFVRRTAGPGVRDLLLPIGEGGAAAAGRRAWQHVVGAGSDSLIALDSTGLMLRVQLRTAPTPHLFEVTQLQLDEPVDQPPVVHNDRVFVADATGRLHVFDAATFDALGEFDLGAPAAGPLRLAGERLYVETANAGLHSYELAPEVRPLWTVARAADGADEDVQLAGPPAAVEAGLLVALRDGSVRLLDAETGETLMRLQLPLPLDGGPLAVGPHTLVATIDGSVYRVDVSAMSE